MNLLPFVHFFSFLVYVYLAVFTLTGNTKSQLNRVCAAMFGAFSLWSFGMIFIHNPNTSKETAKMFEDIGALGWASFPSFLLCFTAIFTMTKKISKTKVFLPLLFIPTLVFIYKQWTNFLIVDYIKQPYGWAGLWSSSVWPYLYYVYYVAFVGIALYLIFNNFWRRTPVAIKKIEARIIFVTTSVAFIFGSLTDVVFPRLGIYRVPDIAPVIVLVWAFGTAYSMARYKFLTITPAAAANDIISTMTDSLILLDQYGNVVTINKAALELLKYTEKEALGGPVAKLFGEEFKKDGLLDKIVNGEEIRNRPLFFKTKDGREVPVIFSSAVLWGEGTSIAGTACIATDITELKKAEGELRRAHHELELRVQERTTDLVLTNEQLQQEISERARVEKELKTSYEKLENILEDMVYVMARIVETKDLYTAGHQRRVAELACAIAKEMGLSQEKVKGIHMAAVIHDIGKISIPSEILSKPGQLNSIEFSMIKTHSQMGHDILKTIDFPWPIAETVLQHHERRDGSGYPSRLSGSQLLLEAEILSVADVVEAMTSHRPYRPALGLDKALEEISKNRGILYHPDVVDACLNLFTKRDFQFTQQKT